MFVPLRITKTEIVRLKAKKGSLFLPKPKAASETFYKSILESVTGEDGTIDGSNLQRMIFPFDCNNYDVFISYSHNDEEEALYLATYLRKKGLSVFIDSTIWYSADSLLDAIDSKYSWANDHIHYDTLKRNFSTSHVHAMLSMAMLEAIRRSECCMFVESPHSLTLKSGIETQTLSPWIYEEATFINNIQPKLPPRLVKPELRVFCEGGNLRVSDSQNQLKSQYKIDLTNFKHIKADDLEVGFGTTILDLIYRQYQIKRPQVLWG